VFWVIVVLASLMALLGFAILHWVREQPADRLTFEHWLHLFGKYHEDGSILTLQHCSSDVRLQFFRTEGKDDSCTLVMRVPSETWSEQCREALERTIDGMGVDRIGSSDSRGSWAVEVRVPIADVRREDSGAIPARIAHRALDAIGLGPSAKFSRTIEGKLSWRYKFEARASDY
jgi:hypothetical protein